MILMRVAQRLGVAAFCLAIASSLPAAAQTRVALIIGNSAYQHTNPLRNPRHDAADVAAVLKGLGFRTVVGLDLDKAAMDRKVRDFAEALAGASVGLFFYAGHGLQVSGRNYLVPVDAKLKTASALEFEAVPLQLVQRVMEGATETNVLFLDACRDNPLARNLARALGTRSSSIGRGLAPIESGVGTLISFSTQPGNVALDGTGRNSPFAEALVQQLSSAQDDLSTALIHVRNQVMASTGNQQVPWEHSALRARLYLSGVPAADAVVPTQQPALGEVAQAWSATKDSESQAVLGAFIAKYKGTVFAELARARLEELQREQQATRVTSAAPPAGPDPVAPSSRHPFDGDWQVAVTGGRDCPVRSGAYTITIRNSTVVGFDGKVSAGGVLNYDRPAAISDDVTIRHAGKLSGDRGTGTYRALGRGCTGTTQMTRTGTSAARRPEPAARGAAPYDGAWEVVVRATRHCPFKKRSFGITIEGGRIKAPHDKPGRVDAQGSFEFHTYGRGNRSITVKHFGRLADASGTGKFQTVGRGCAGTSVLKRLADPATQ